MDNQPAGQTATFRSTLKSDLLNRAARRASLWGGGGALLLIFGGSCLPVPLLKLVGIPLFVASLLCIACGLLPYKRLVKLQTHPHKIEIDAQDFFFYRQGKPALCFKWAHIDRVGFVEDGSMYGMALWLKEPKAGVIRILERRFSARHLTISGYDLFLPYFSSKSVGEIEEIVHGEDC